MDSVQLQVSLDFEGLCDVKEIIFFYFFWLKMISISHFCKSILGFGIPHLKQLNSRSGNIQLTVDQWKMKFILPTESVN